MVRKLLKHPADTYIYATRGVKCKRALCPAVKLVRSNVLLFVGHTLQETGRTDTTLNYVVCTLTKRATSTTRFSVLD